MNLQTIVASVLIGLQAAGLLPQLPAQYVSKPPASGDVVARVNGQDIKGSDVEPLLWDWRAQEVTEDLISFALIKGEAKRQGVTASPAEVEAAFAKQLESVKSQMKGQDVDEVMRRQGFTRSRVYIRTEADLLLAKIVDLGFHASDYVKVSTLVFPFAGESLADHDAASKKAQTAYARLQKGESWDALLASTGQEANLVQNRGLVGWRATLAFPEPVRKTISGAKPGTVTEPVLTPNGVQIFRIELQGNEAKVADLDQLKAQYGISARQKLMQKLRTEAKIEHVWK